VTLQQVEVQCVSFIAVLDTTVVKHFSADAGLLCDKAAVRAVEMYGRLRVVVQARSVVFRCFLYLRILAPFKGVNWFAI